MPTASDIARAENPNPLICSSKPMSCDDNLPLIYSFNVVLFIEHPPWDVSFQLYLFLLPLIYFKNSNHIWTAEHVLLLPYVHSFAHTIPFLTAQGPSTASYHHLSKSHRAQMLSPPWGHPPFWTKEPLPALSSHNFWPLQGIKVYHHSIHAWFHFPLQPKDNFKNSLVFWPTSSLCPMSSLTSSPISCII